MINVIERLDYIVMKSTLPKWHTDKLMAAHMNPGTSTGISNEIFIAASLSGQQEYSEL